MVILSASVCNQEGKVLVARQFVSMSRLRIEGLLSAFPKLLSSDQGEKQKQHTYVETDEVRYLYQPMDTMYVLIVTNVRSNILQDLQTLRLLAKLVPEYCQGHDEESIVENAFDLIFAFDEAVSLGHSEDVNMDKIKTYMEMDSHEEKLANIIKETQLINANKIAQDNAKRLAAARQEPNHMTGIGSSSNVVDGGSYPGSGSNYGSSGGYNDNSNSYTSKPLDGGSDEEDDDKNVRSVGGRKGKKSKNKGKSKGMSLGMPGRKKVNSDLAAMMEEDQDKFGASYAKRPASSATTESDDYGSTDNVKIKIQEKCTIECERDGTMKKFLVDGAVNLIVMNPDFARINISVEKDGMEATFRTHPKVDKKTWKKESTICWKDKESGFPVGSSNKQSVLKWKIKSKEDEPPLKVDFWSNEENGVTVITCSYEVDGLPDDMTLQNVVLTIPGIEQKPEVTSEEDVEHTYDRGNQEFQWALGDIENGSTGEIEMTLGDDADDEDQFYPITINFASENLFSGLKIASVSTFDDEEVEYVCTSECFASEFQII